MSILSILKEAVPVDGVYAYGNDFDLNIIDETHDWVYMVEFPVRGTIDVEQEYVSNECIILIGQFSQFELGTEDHMPTIDEAGVRANTYLSAIWEHFNTLTNVRFSHFKNRFDANLSGVRISFTSEIQMEC